MKIALLSDIHGNLPALEAVVRDAKRRGISRFVNLGDILSGPLMPRETAQYLMTEGWVTLAGNHERQVLTFHTEEMSHSDAFTRASLTDPELNWLRGLPTTHLLTPDIFLCHGTPTDDLEYLLEVVEPGQIRVANAAELATRLGEMQFPVIACGHSHTPRSVRTSSGTLIVNPGSVGLQAYDDDRPYFHIVETGSPDARYAILEETRQGWIADLITVPYAHLVMSDLALKNGGADWAVALRTGYALRRTP